MSKIPPELAREIDNLLVAGSHLRRWLKPGHPPFDASLAEGLAHYKIGNDGVSSAAFDLWAGCRAIERVRAEYDGPGGLAIPAVPPAEPDEAPGLDVPKPSDGAFAQERLAATQIGET